MDAGPRVAVLMASYNGASWIEDQVASILAQIGVAVEVIISDDASTDDSVSCVRRHWGFEPRLRVISRKSGSGSAGGNFLGLFREIDVSGFDFVALADQDDVWSKDKLLAAINALRQQGAAGYSSAVTAFWRDGKQVLLSQNGKTRAADFLFEGAGQGCTFVLKQEFFQRVQTFLRAGGDFTPAFHFHDWLIYLLGRTWGERWIFDPVPRMAYRQHAGNEIGARAGSSAFFRRVRLIRCGWYGSQVKVAYALYLRAGGADMRVQRIGDAIAEGGSRGLLASVKLASFVLSDGRRRRGDRLILVFSALMRWI